MIRLFSNRRIFMLMIVLITSGILITVFLALLNFKKTIGNLDSELSEIVQRQKSLITVLKEQGQSDDTIIGFIISMREKYYGIGKTGEFVIASVDGDSIKLLLSSSTDSTFKISRKKSNEVPMRLALSGKSGFIYGKDYKGVEVYAAFSFIPSTSMGIVAQIPAKEIVQPYERIVIFSSLIILFFILVSIFLFIKIIKPLVIENIESQEIYRSLFNNNHVVMLLVDPETLTIVDANPAACEYYGYSCKEMVSMKVTNINTLQPEELKDVIKRIKGGKEKYFNFKHKLSDNSIRDVEVYSGTVQLKNKVFIYSLIYDITDRKLAEEILKESEEKFRIAFYNAPMGMTMVKPNGRFLAVNSIVCQMVGYSREKLLSITFNDITHPDDIERGNLWVKKMISGDHSEPEFEKRYIHKDGHIVWAIVRAIWIYNPDGTARMSVVHIQDITERKKVEEELIKYREHLEERVVDRTKEIEALNEELVQSNEELKVTNQVLAQQKNEISHALDQLKETQEKLIESEKMASLGVLTAGVAHEINNPLNFIQTGIYSIENILFENKNQIKLGKNEKVLKEIIEKMNIGIKRATEIITSLNHFSRKSISDEQDCNLHVVIDNCLLILDHQIKSTCIIKKNYVKEELHILGNEGKLHQVFINILKNSIQSISENGAIEIDTLLNEKENMVQIKITDTGKGIERENLKKIFDPFFTTKDPGQGAGLGLSIVYSIIKEHKGNIEYKSVVNKGTEVTVSLPKT